MRFVFKRKDGGPNSTVTGYWLVEAKSLFSIVLLRFDEGSREVFHSHAFNALTWWLWGEVEERFRLGGSKVWRPSLKPKFTSRNDIHKVVARRRSWAVSFRGPWKPVWREYLPTGEVVVLTHGRIPRTTSKNGTLR